MKTHVLPFLLALFMVFLVALIGDFSSAQAPDGQEALDAKLLFQEHCASCHGTDGRAKTFRGFVTFAKNLTRPEWQALVKDEHLKDAIKEGPGLMPGYKETFSETEIDALVGFVRSLGAESAN